MRYLLFLMAFLNINALAAKAFDADYYMQHPEALQKIILCCQKDNIDNKAYCEQAFSLAEKIAHLFEELIESPQTWGKKIMEKQYQLVELQEKGASKEKVDALKHEIITLQAIARLASGR